MMDLISSAEKKTERLFDRQTTTRNTNINQNYRKKPSQSETKRSRRRATSPKRTPSWTSSLRTPPREGKEVEEEEQRNRQQFEPLPSTHFHPHLRWLNGKASSPRTGVCLLVGCLTSQQHSSVSQGGTCPDNFTCCHTEIEVADQTFYLTQWQCSDTWPTSPSADPITPGAWQGSHWSAIF